MKKYLAILLVILLCAIPLLGCAKPETPDETPKDTQNDTQEDLTVDYSMYPFTDISWERDAEDDIETIRFGADGHFTYYCSCGNPVNDSDLCEGYTYDDATKTVTLDCIETTEEMVTVITIVKCEENELHLDFDGEIRIFTKE